MVLRRRLVAVGPLEALVNSASKYPGSSAVGKHGFELRGQPSTGAPGCGEWRVAEQRARVRRPYDLTRA
jgi:hypothetical protein